MQQPWIIFLIIWLNLYLGVSGAVECKYESEESKTIKYTITVGRSGKEQLKTIQGAIDSILPNKDYWTRIHVSPGLYMEKVIIPPEKTCIYLEGSGRHDTIVYYNGHEQTNTSATFFSYAENIAVKGFTFQNSYNRPLTGKIDGEIKQAVAVAIFGDKTSFYGCRFVGLQDTLWDAQGRHYFRSCYIEGAIDFIFGNGQSIYENCKINATAGSLPPYIQAGYITAQGRLSPTDPSGFVFRGGIVSGSGKNYLGRAYGPYSRVIFDGTTFAAVIFPPGWNAWYYPEQQGNFVHAEVYCKGPGSNTSGRVPWVKKQLGQREMSKFSRSLFIDHDGWLAKQPAWRHPHTNQP
ncbi:hypothetical protein JCGZ_05014 [Jatropha curcas]|uniref:Pectinesterase n=1 Tax=Jatropha curcas TaxID=180498 RepID=A0A067KRV5_JATCU|nr:putative pectinesterase 52 [Jatropha curcas]KDP38857.1 hypothetical protein JCGZ_05014 [Jatropha curcas]